MENITKIDVHNNRLDGQCSPHMRFASSLYYDVGDIENLPYDRLHMEYLDVSYNHLYGTCENVLRLLDEGFPGMFPSDQLCSYTAMRGINAAQNWFYGSIGSCYCNLQNLFYIEMLYNSLEGNGFLVMIRSPH